MTIANSAIDSLPSFDSEFLQSHEGVRAIACAAVNDLRRSEIISLLSTAVCGEGSFDSDPYTHEQYAFVDQAVQHLRAAHDALFEFLLATSLVVSDSVVFGVAAHD